MEVVRTIHHLWYVYDNCHLLFCIEVGHVGYLALIETSKWLH